MNALLPAALALALGTIGSAAAQVPAQTPATTQTPPQDPATPARTVPPATPQTPAAPPSTSAAPTAEQSGTTAPLTGTAQFTDAQGDPVTIVSRTPTPPPRDFRAEFAAMDRDGSGTVDRREAAGDKYLLRAWSALDGDRDGRLNYDEMLRWLDD